MDKSLEEKIKEHQILLIEEGIKLGEILPICCVTGLVKTSDGEWVEYQFKEPYHRLSHGYSPGVYKQKMQEIRDMFPKVKDWSYKNGL